jgi:2-polyprenyl-3-methyl-5-hydroxy-6-metoxy-1,4-benzoquinol methylase
MLLVLMETPKPWRWRLAQALEIRWWKRYLSPKDPAEYAVWKTAYWKNFLKKIGLPEPSGARILDAGCGPAGIFSVLEKNNRTEALDPLLEAYERELPHFSSKKYPEVRFWAQPLETFAPERPFDLVFCLNAINHVADLERCIRVLADCTDPNGGLLVLSTDTHRWSLAKRIFRLLPGDALHPHQHSLADYEELLARAGLTVQKKILLQKETIFEYWALVCSRSR